MKTLRELKQAFRDKAPAPFAASSVWDRINAACSPDHYDEVLEHSAERAIVDLREAEWIAWATDVQDAARAQRPEPHDLRGIPKNTHITF